MADDQSPGDRAVSACEIDDVFLVSTECSVARDFNQSQLLEDVTVLHHLAMDTSVYAQTRTFAPPNEGQVHIIRYILRGEVRYSYPGRLVDLESPEAEVLGKLIHTFAVDYKCPPDFFKDNDAVSSFGRNAAFHVWSFWREAVMADSARFRLPRQVIPMFKTKSPFIVDSNSQAPSKPSSDK